MRDEVAAAYAAAGREAEVAGLPRRHGGALRARPTSCSRRSGATTCAELTAAGKAAVLVPFAAAADDHQRTNAARHGGRGRGARWSRRRTSRGESLARAVGGRARGAGPARRPWRRASRAAGPSRRRGARGGPAGRPGVTRASQDPALHFVGHRRLGHERHRRGAAEPGLHRLRLRPASAPPSPTAWARWARASPGRPRRGQRGGRARGGDLDRGARRQPRGGGGAPARASR